MKRSVRSCLLTIAAVTAIGTGGTLLATTAALATDHSQGTSGTSGNPNSPQPLSNADQNSGGANGQCPGATYCSTRDGSASQNGSDNGNHSGEPCAGCVGKADNKNPPGQEKQDPLGTFPNNGYECDNNQGIGQTNPAHTGCTPSPTPTPTPTGT